MKTPSMAAFKQQNVDDFYEIGEELGRWVFLKSVIWRHFFPATGNIFPALYESQFLPCMLHKAVAHMVLCIWVLYANSWCVNTWNGECHCLSRLRFTTRDKVSDVSTLYERKLYLATKCLVQEGELNLSWCCKTWFWAVDHCVEGKCWGGALIKPVQSRHQGSCFPWGNKL